MTGGVDNTARGVVTLENAPDIPDVMSETGDNEIRVIVGRRRPCQSTARKNLMPRQSYEHRMFDIVIKSVAIADALQGKLCGKRYDLGQSSVRGTETISNIPCEERAQRVSRQLWKCDHTP